MLKKKSPNLSLSRSVSSPPRLHPTATSHRPASRRRPLLPSVGLPRRPPPPVGRPPLRLDPLNKTGEGKTKKAKGGKEETSLSLVLSFLDTDDTDLRGDGVLRRRDAVGDVPERAAAAALGTRRRGPRRAPRLGAHLVLLLLGASRRRRRPGGPCGRRGGAAGGGADPGAVRADGSALAVHPRQGPAGPLEEVRRSSLDP